MHSALDVTDPGAVEDAVKEKDVIVHLAAFTNVDACETHREEAMAVNGGGTQNVVTAARKHGARVIYMSTDYVFKGDAGDHDAYRSTFKRWIGSSVSMGCAPSLGQVMPHPSKSSSMKALNRAISSLSSVLISRATLSDTSGRAGGFQRVAAFR